MALGTNWTPPKDAIVSETEGWTPPEDAILETPKKKVPTEAEPVKPTGQESSVGLKTTQPTSGSESSLGEPVGSVTQQELLKINEFLKSPESKKTAKAVMPEAKPIDLTENILTEEPSKEGVTLNNYDAYIQAAPKAYEEDTFTILSNAYERGINQADLAANLTASGGNPDVLMIDEIARIQEENRSLKSSEAYQKFTGAKSFGEAIGVLTESPSNFFTVMTELGIESLTAQAKHGLVRMAAGGGIGFAMGGPVGAGVGIITGMGLSSLNLEYSGKMMEVFQEMGVDTTDPKQLEDTFSDDAKVAEARSSALKKGIPVAVFDAISGGVAGRIVSKPAKTLVRKALLGTGEMAVQAGLGAGGEFVGQKVAGERTNWASVLAEALAEGYMGVAEAGGAIAYRKAVQATTPKESVIRTVSALPDDVNKAEVIKDQIDVQLVTGQIDQAQADEMSSVAMQAIEAEKVVPPQIPQEIKSDVLPILVDKQEIQNQIAELESQKESTDPAFHKAIDEQIKPLKTQVETYNSEIEKLTTPQPESVTMEWSGDDVKAKNITLDAKSIQSELDNVDFDIEVFNERVGKGFVSNEQITESYIDAKQNGNNPELIDAVEALIGSQPQPNAVQIETAGQVPVQPKAGTRQEVAERKPQAEPEEVAQESEAVTIEQKNRPTLRIGDMEGMDEGAKRFRTMSTPTGETIVFKKNEDGEIFAVNLATKDVVGFATKLSDTETDLSVVSEFQQKGIGTELLAEFYKENPNFPTGGLTPLGKKTVEAVKRTQPQPTQPEQVSVQETPKESKEIEKVSQSAGIKATNLRDLYNISRNLFGQNRVKSLASAVIMDRMIGQMAKRAGIPKSEMYGRLEFKKADSALNALELEGALFQGNINGKIVQLRNMDVDVVNGFYSPIEKRLAETKIEKQSANKWLAVVGKGDEATWTGVKAWLESKQPTEQVSKSEIQQWMKDNRVSVVEVVGSEKEGNLPKSPMRGRITSLQLEGEKENYKEVLVTLPRKLKSEDRIIYSVYDKIDGSLIGEYTGRFMAEVIAKRENGVISESKIEEIGYEDTLFTSSHFDEPNILVHLRMNTRTDANGDKVLFLEEVQSDWGQKGKKEGFVKSKQEVEKEYNEADKKLDELNKLFDSKYGEDFSPDMLSPEEYSDYSSAATKRARLGSQLDSGRFEGMPNAPFVTDTNAWVKLALKVALKEAVKQGATKIAWTTGEQQNERYDLSKQVKSIYYRKNSDGTYIIQYLKLDGTDGEFGDNINENQLEDIVGKELANKIIADEGNPVGANGYKIFTGLDLKVGGKGMIGFYGSPKDGKLGIVGQVAESLFKQKVGSVEVKTTDKESYEIQDKYGYVAYFNDKASADKFLAKSEGSRYIKDTFSGTAQPSITITPELKASVEAGLPLFQNKKGAAMVAQDGTAIIYALTDPNISTPLHELAHVFEHYLTDAERNAVMKAAKTKEWTRETSEYFARGFEKYLAEGISPVKELQKIFDKFKEWLTEIYNGIKGSDIDIKLNKPMKAIYDSMIADKQQKTKQDGKQEKGSDTKDSKSDKKAKTLGVGRGRVPKDKRKIKDKRYLAALNIETTDPYAQVLQWFIRGGKVTANAVKQVLKGKEELRRRIGLLSKGGVDDVRVLAEIMMANQWIEGQHDDMTFREAVEDVILSHNGTATMVDELLNNYTNSTEQQFDPDMLSDEERELYDENLMVESYYESLSEEERDVLFGEVPPTDEEIDAIAKEIIDTEAKDVPNAKQIAIDKIAKGLDGLIGKIGAKKNLTDDERTTIIEDLKSIIDGAIELGGITVKEALDFAISKLKSSGIDMTDEDVKTIEDAVVVPKETGKRTKKKAILNRAYKGATTAGIENKIAEYGLDYYVESWDEASKNAEAFVADVGIESALDAVRGGLLQGGANPYIYGMAIDAVQTEIRNATTREEQIALTIERDGLIREFDERYRSIGREISALQDVYEKFDFPYDREQLIPDLQKLNKGEEIDPKTLRDAVELAAKLEKVNEELNTYKEKLADAEAKIAFDKLRDAVIQEQTEKLSTSKKAKKLADKVREGKINRPSAFMAATPASIIWDGAVELTALTIQVGGNIAEAVEKGLEYIRQSDWYKNLSDDKKTNAEQQFVDYHNQYEDEDSVQTPTVDEDGKIIIPFSFIKSLIEGGIDNINDLTDAVYNELKDEFPDITPRQVRDAITKYGQTKFPSKDKLKQKIAELKRDGQLLSALEDVLSGKPPKKSGLQRKPPTDSQREMTRKIKDAMKDLPVEEADIEKRWATVNGRIKTTLENRIKDLNDQITKGQREVRNTNKTELTDENKALKAEVERLNAVLDALVGKPALTHEQRVKNAIKTMQANIEKLQRMIVEGDIAFKEKDKLSDPRLDVYREQMKALREQLAKAREDAGLVEQRRIEQYRKKIKKDIADMERMIAEGKFDKKERKLPPELDREGKKLLAERMMLKDKIEEIRERIRLKNATKIEKLNEFLVDVLDIPRDMVASADLSAPLRQGVILGVRNPVIASKAFVDSVRWAFSKKSADEYIAAIKASPEYVTMKEAGLYLSHPTAKLTVKEEIFRSNLARKIPVWGKVIEGTGRSYTGYLNKLRVDVFMQFYDMLVQQGYTGQELKKELKSFAGWVNNASGRGDLVFPALNQASPLFGSIFFAPKFVASRLNVLYRLATLGAGMPKQARIEMLKTMGTFIGLGAIVLAIMSAAGADVEDDPTSSDFGKIKFGNTRYDIWGGLQQWVVYLSRMKEGSYKKTTTGEIIPFNTGGYNSKTYVDATTDFLESKMSPTLNMLLEFGRGEYKYDKKFFGYELAKRGDQPDITSSVLGNLSPIWLQDIKEVAETEGASQAMAMGTASFFGVGAQNYKPGVEDMMMNEAYNAIVTKYGNKRNVKNSDLEEYGKKVTSIKKFESDEEFKKTKQSDAIKTAIMMFRTQKSPSWYRTTYYITDSDRKLMFIVYNTMNMTKAQRNKTIEELKEAKIISSDFLKEKLEPTFEVK